MAGVPGVNTAPGAALAGSLIGMTEPTAEGESRTENMMTGGAMGVAGQQLAKHALQKPINYLAKRQSLLADDVGFQTLQQGKKLGFRVNPTQAHPTIKNRLLEGWAGKISTGQSVSEYNQNITNNIAKRALGMTDDTPLTMSGIKSVRDNAGKAYRNIAKLDDRFSVDDAYLKDLSEIAANSRELAQDFPSYAGKDTNIENLIEIVQPESGSMSAKNAIEMVKRLRDEATSLFRKNTLNPDTAERALAFANKRAAEALDDLIGRNLQNLGKAELHGNWRNARQLIAKTHQVERAFNEGSGNVIAHKIARSYSKGDPFSGELEDLAKFALRFDRATQEIKSSMPGISPLDVGATMIAASSQQAGGINPKAVISAMALRPAVRGLITSGPYQRMFVNPGGGPAAAAAAAKRAQLLAGPASAAAAPDLIEQGQGLLNY